jgi:hypothetical protein
MWTPLPALPFIQHTPGQRPARSLRTTSASWSVGIATDFRKSTSSAFAVIGAVVQVELGVSSA